MNIKFKFMKFRRIAGIVSICLFVVSIISLGVRGLSLGLDFSGGTLIEVSYESPVDLEDIRSSLEENGYPDFQVVNFGTNLDVLIKVSDQGGNSSIGENIFSILNEQQKYQIFFNKALEELGVDSLSELEDDKKQEFLDYVDKSYNANEMDESASDLLELKRVEFVGSQIGDEFLEQGTKGALTALFMILMYVAFRFQYKFAIGAVSALGHDVLIILGLFSIFGWDFDLTVLAALLAVIGYSLNDTIVVSDRIRENFRTERILEPIDMIDLSLNQTLGRTIVTSFTTTCFNFIYEQVLSSL